MVLKSIDYRLVEEEKGRIDRAVIIINDFHRLDLTKSEVWKLMQTLETVFDSMSDAKGIEAPFSNRKVVTGKGLKSPSFVKKRSSNTPVTHP